ncbi:DeoR/GlpR family DNA-binding transcription regulator [Bacillus glycinifermentans]|uniref:DeoR/GlpR family DNA-binding transcription regulator n=1 Tax=Bacillus glycinifermentans TaxID=1664069 RepID=UPI001C210AA1|nr:DeoR/GlpR family DNA-binding transcription regulator [Bacillus glycinifermentans]MBU8788712.1 DeoR/GlpR family DNA-binding transcription regulator [Bacillus glycinifermentans]
MQPNERRNVILEQLNKHQKIDIEALAAELNVSAMTIRRDLAYLEEQEQIIRTHGGAVLNKPLVAESSFLTKEGKHAAEKKLIAQKAAELVKENYTILLDSGTTTLEIAKLLKHKSKLTVVTNDIKIAAELMDSEVKLILTGGEVQNNIGALFGPLTEQTLRNLHVDLCFLGAHAVDLQAGVTVPTFEKASIKKLMIESARSTWLVADASKLDQKALVKVCGLKELSGIISDSGIADYHPHELRELLDVIAAEEEPE